MDNRGVKVSDETMKLLAATGTPTLCGTLTHRLQYRNNYMTGIVPLALKPGQKMIGRARTLRFIPMREDLLKAQYDSLTGSPHRNALEGVGLGEVLVVDAGGCMESGIAGDMFSRRIFYRGCQGLVVDGVVRDLSVIKTVGLAVFGRGMHGAGIPRCLMSVGQDEPVRCGDIPVIPGDIIVGDEDGVVVVPPQIADELARDAFQHQEEEEWIRMKLDSGSTLHEVYPPNEAMRKEMEAWLAEKRRKKGQGTGNKPQPRLAAKKGKAGFI